LLADESLVNPVLFDQVPDGTGYQSLISSDMNLKEIV
jgi:hypothetical protein